jgi:hypothetical protein
MRCPQRRFENREGHSLLRGVRWQAGVDLPGLRCRGSAGPEVLRRARPAAGGRRRRQPCGAAKFSSPGAYTPKHLAERIPTSKSALEGERKQVTVPFADQCNPGRQNEILSSEGQRRRPTGLRRCSGGNPL